SGVLLEMPSLQSTPQLALVVFAFQDEQKKAREAAKAIAPPANATPSPEASPATDNGPRRGLSLSTIAKEIAGYIPGMKTQDGNGSPTMSAGESVQGENMQPPAAKPAPQPQQPAQPLNVIQKTFRAEALARLQRAVLSESGFTERLVAFWSNHFCISANKGPLARMWAGSFEREAIRPHVLGRFAEMLKAVEQHPAMLFFLDNQQSLGPDSRAGQNRKRGLNENLAREIMELHTLGVGGGYSQDD